MLWALDTRSVMLLSKRPSLMMKYLVTLVLLLLGGCAPAPIYVCGVTADWGIGEPMEVLITQSSVDSSSGKTVLGGFVRDGHGRVLPGSHVILIETKDIVFANVQGYFKLEGLSDQQVIEFRFAGYQTIRSTVGEVVAMHRRGEPLCSKGAA